MYFPFSAFIGYHAARRALLCTLVDPTLRGLIISGPIGTGKSALVRSFGRFVRAHVDPDTPFTQVPLGVSEDRLIGGLDLDVSLATGELRLRSGLIAAAHDGYLFIDDLPLLDERATATVLRALESEIVVCEREGLSACEPSRFVLLGTAVPSERELSVIFADRVAFLIAQERRATPEAVRLLLQRLEGFRSDPGRFYAEFDALEQSLAEQVATARLLYGMIGAGHVAAASIAEAALKLGVTGNRADVFAMKAARAHAALRGSRTVEDEDLKFAIATVLAPRAETVPDESPSSNDERQEPTPPDAGEQGETRESSGGQADREEGGEAEESGSDGEGSGEALPDDERTFEGIDFTAPLASLAEFFPVRRGASAGSHGANAQWLRGRHTRSLQTEPGGKRIAVGATLRAAAPHQRRRGLEGEGRMVVRSEDIRVKKFAERAGTLFIFCVDASGSMAMNRMRETKGAVTRLLQEAYVNRDSVALIAFRGADAELLLPPTSSVERAKRSLDVLPTGGGTPLASALVKAYALVEKEKRRGAEQVLVVVLTDGRANVPLAENAAGMIMEIRRRHVRKELDNIASAYRRSGVRAIVIDTKQTYGANSDATRLAETLGARYYFLPQIDARGLADVVREAAQ